MSATSSHGRDGRGRNQPDPLRRPTRSESAQARKQLKGWRARKLGWIAVGTPVVLIAVVGVAMAAPHHHRNTGLPACVPAAGTTTGAAAPAAGTSSSAAAAGNGAANVQTVNGASNRMLTYHNHNTQTAAAGAGATTSAAAGAATTSAAAGAGAGTTTTAAAGAGTTTTAAAGAGTTTTTAAAATTTTAAACASTTAAATTSAAAAAATPNPNCTLIVPADPLTAAGLATPYQLVATDKAMGPCNEANAGQSAFVEGAILTAAGQLTLYDPLVIDQGTQPAAPTVAAQVPAGSTVGLWFGFNGTNLTLQAANGTTSLAQGNCVNGVQGSIFGQFASCNGQGFFTAANQAIAANMLQVPAAGTATDGLPCPTTRDFSLVDQDQSDNVVTHYLATANGQIAQMNAASMAALQNTTDLANGSDNLLLTKFVDPALGCTPFTRPNQSSDGQATSALPLDELSAAANAAAPIAIVPLTDPMVLNNANADQNKANAYRLQVNQLPIGAAGADAGSGATYCTNLFGNPAGIARVFKDMAMFQNAPSVDAAMATNLFTFLAMRANQSFTNLNCQGLLNMPNPIALTTNGAGVVTAAVMVPLGQTPPTAAAGATTPAAGTATTPAATATTGATPTPTMTMRKHPKKVHW